MHSLAEQAGIGDGLWIKLALDHAMRSIPVYLSLDIAVQQFAVTIDIRQAELDVSFRSFNIFGDNALRLRSSFLGSLLSIAAS